MDGPLASWDVFHADRLELERGLSTAAVRAALATRRPARRRPGPARRHDGRLGAAGRHGPGAVEPTAPPVARRAVPTPASGAGPVRSADSARSPRLATSRSCPTRPSSSSPLPDAPAVQRPPTGSSSRSETDDVAFPVINDPLPEPNAVDFALPPPRPTFREAGSGPRKSTKTKTRRRRRLSKKRS